MKIRFEKEASIICLCVFLNVMNDLVTADGTDSGRLRDARQSLEYVENIKRGDCSGGTDSILTVNFDHNTWNKYARVAVKTANLLTKNLMEGNGRFQNITPEDYFFNLVRNNVDGESLIFGSAIAVEPFVFPAYEIYSPYAHRNGSKVNSFDLSTGYNYLRNDTEWYHTLRIRPWNNLTEISINTYRPRLNASEVGPVIILQQPIAKLEHGHWTYPYYDCGGGNIWMVTYSSPILAANLSLENPIYFRGVATIDIELTNIDINQCDANNSISSDTADVFRGTHVCRNTTYCSPLTGLGFRRGAYVCKCKDGFYFPYADPSKAFNGSDIEELLSRNGSNMGLEWFQCKKCSLGCDTCVDDSPCLFDPNHIIRISLLLVTVAMISLILFASVVLWAYREVRAIKAASPIFLFIMAGGAILMCTEMFIDFVEPSPTICLIRPWPRELGFALAYGALLLKTWRISSIMKIQSARKLQLSDKELLKRFIPILLVPCAYLAAWSAAVPLTRRLELRKTPQDLKFYICAIDWWEYCCSIGEACFLLWGVYLSYVIRKAPSHLNESKYITWSIYNTVLLGNFLFVIRVLIAVSRDPDLMYVMSLIRLQVTVTSMMCLIYIPKLYALVVTRGGKEDNIRGAGTINTSRPQTEVMVGMPIADMKNASVQTDVTGPIQTAEDRTASMSNSSPTIKLRGMNKVHPV
ncbi:metabotropic glycine receptor-like [Lineus longissimus]|uniref:metabotropic glycine receptor-like n=1 Tax=Lineus longissimus TaxID=88925 RepID=UPI00315D1C19